MIPINRTIAPIQVLVDEFARCGVTDAVCSPGSRNAPILLALEGEAAIAAHSVLDERCAGFVALGLARASGRPVLVTCTSGTAAANLLPAVVEADQAGLPLIVLTADRPPELRDVGAGQAIDQIKLYGDAVRWFVEVGSHDPGPTTATHHRALACRAVAEATAGRRGPVHLNLPLREPLDATPEPLDAADWAGRSDGRAWTRSAQPTRRPDAAVIDAVADELSSSRGAIVCGEGVARVRDELVALASALGWPLLADPLSGLRCGPHDRSHVICHYDGLLRHDAFTAGAATEVVLRFGETPTSKPLRAWLAGRRQVVIDPGGGWHEPTRTAGLLIDVDPATLAAGLRTAVATPSGTGWIDSWRTADALVPEALASVAAVEARTALELGAALADGDVLWVSSSMPIRDVEAFFPSRPADVRILANRGANGIDGVVSSAAGAALATRGRTYLLIGELALIHDVGGLIAARRLGADLTIVCIDNGGGGIFDFLPVANDAPPGYERLLATPHEVALSDLAALAGLAHQVVEPTGLPAALAAGGLFEVRSDRADNVAAHRAIGAHVAAALARLDQ